MDANEKSRNSKIHIRKRFLPIAGWLADYPREWLRPDVIAGVTTAAVVIPKAMAYATIAGLPVEVGLYTAFIPMVIYAVLGTSRPLSVSTTSTIAILVAAELAMFVSGRRHGPACRRCRHTDFFGRSLSPSGRYLSPGVYRQFYFRPGIDRFQGGNRPGDCGGPGAQAAGCSLRERRVLPQYLFHFPARSRDERPDASDCSDHAGAHGRFGALPAARSGAPVRRGTGNSCLGDTGIGTGRRRTCGQDSSQGCQPLCCRIFRWSGNCGRVHWASP